MDSNGNNFTDRIYKFYELNNNMKHTEKVSRDYLGGMKLETESLRKYQYTILESPHKEIIGKKIMCETKTPVDKDSGMLIGASEVSFYHEDSKTYKTINGIMNYIKKKYCNENI